MLNLFYFLLCTFLYFPQLKVKMTAILITIASLEGWSWGHHRIKEIVKILIAKNEIEAGK